MNKQFTLASAGLAVDDAVTHAKKAGVAFKVVNKCHVGGETHYNIFCETESASVTLIHETLKRGGTAYNPLSRAA